MKIPRAIAINGKIWKIIRKKDLRNEEGQSRMGLTDVDNRIIEIESVLEPKELELTFWHEITHASLYENHLTDLAGGLPELVEEQICEVVAEMIISTQRKLK